MWSKIRQSRLALLSLLLSIPLVGSLYVWLNRLDLPSFSLETDLDRQIPFLKIFILPYLGWYAFLLAGFVYLAFRDKTVYLRTLARFLIGMLVCYAVYLFYQTTVSRPDVSGDGILDWLVLLVYRHDQPYNCFPSTHVLTSYCMLKAYREASGIRLSVRWAVAGIAVLIMLSTLFVKQHVLLDAAGAIAVVEAVYAAFRLLTAARSSRRLNSIRSSVS